MDESIYPELHELMEATPMSKRARVLANLAYKACLLSNAALMNSGITAPPIGRSSSGRKKKQVRKKSQKTEPEAYIQQSSTVTNQNDGTNDQPEHQTYSNDYAKQMEDKSSGNDSQSNSTDMLVKTDSVDMLEQKTWKGSTSGQQIDAAGEGSGEKVAQEPVRKKRRLLK
ncbi:hypothetical protein [Xenorhabdus sp. KJ12.1]|uniref:hypothetical protein n=1 Tax=Xenorhabdus sp. KJ12.1 TaxID=1851571 RepID=UPI0012904C2E|nr:hypothetical protein [Xenorhabdus sp. KJ12.1]